jgi:hypothetical protein
MAQPPLDPTEPCRLHREDGAYLHEQLAVRVAEVGAYAAANELGVDRKTAMKYSNA